MMTDLQPSTGPKAPGTDALCAHPSPQRCPRAFTAAVSKSSLIASHRHHSMDAAAVLRPDCRICLQVDDGVRKALHKELQILPWKGHQLEAPEEASQPQDHCQTHACGIISDFAGALCAAHAARHSLSSACHTSVVRLCANESALGLQCAQALETNCFLPAAICVFSHDPGNPSPMGVRLFAPQAGQQLFQSLRECCGMLWQRCCCLHSAAAAAGKLLWQWRRYNGSLR